MFTRDKVQFELDLNMTEHSLNPKCQMIKKNDLKFLLLQNVPFLNHKILIIAHRIQICNKKKSLKMVNISLFGEVFSQKKVVPS